MSKMVKRHIPSQGSLAEFEKFFVELPKHIKEQLLQGKLRFNGPGNYGDDLMRVKQVQDGRWQAVWPTEVADGAKLRTN